MPIFLTIKNVGVLLKRHTSIFVFIFISLVICTVISLLASGMVDSVPQRLTKDQMESLEGYYNEYVIDFSNGCNPVVGNGLTKPPENDEVDYLYRVYDTSTGELLYEGMDFDKAYEIYKPFSEEINEYQEENQMEMPYSEYKLWFTYVSIPSNFDELPKVSDIRDRVSKIIKAAGVYFEDARILGVCDNKSSINYMAKIGDDTRKENEVDISYSKFHFADGLQSEINKGDTIEIGSEKYTVRNVEITDDEGGPTYVNARYEDVGDFIVNNFVFALTEDAPEEVRKKVDDLVEELFTDYSPDITPPSPKPLIEKQFNNMVYMISFIIMAVIMMNISRLYSYIISLRKNTVAVYRLCGADKAAVYLICLIEIAFLLCTSYAVGVLLFHFGVVNGLSFMFPTFSEFFTLNIYLISFAIYLVLGIFILFGNIVPYIRKSIDEGVRRAN